MSRITQLKQKRAAKVAEARAFLDSVEAEKREMTSEDNAKYDAIMADVEQIGKTIEAEERQIELERSIAQATAEEQEERGNSQDVESAAEILEAAARSYILTGVVDQRAETEWRALQAGSDTAGGYLVMPEQFVQRLIKAVDDAVVIRRLATTFQVPNAASLGAPSLDNDPADSDWTTEIATGSEDSTMSFGKRNLHPKALAKRIKVSNQFLRSGMMNPENLVISRLAYKFGITEEKAFLTGTGDDQPLGLFTAATSGISTGRDVSTDNTTTAITFDGLINNLYNLKVQYQDNASWLFHRDAIKMIAKLKDGDNNYIWRPAVTEARPDTILGRPVIQSEYVPNTFATGLYVGMVGDFSNYWIADALNMQVKRLEELYAETNQTGFIGRKEVDGMPVLEEAFSRVTLA